LAVRKARLNKHASALFRSAAGQSFMPR